MKFVAVGNDVKTKLVDLNSAGGLTILLETINDVPVKSVKFCPGSSGINVNIHYYVTYSKYKMFIIDFWFVL